jgi:hypothetical protein
MIQDEEQAYLTKGYLIRYCEEEVEINDVVMFRAEVDVEPGYMKTHFYLESELYFSDLANMGGPDNWEAHVNDFESKCVFKMV